jgi:phosphate transport system permease protein
MKDKKIFTEKFAKIIFISAAVVSIAAIFTICIFLFANGIPALREIGLIKFMFGSVWNPSGDKFGILTMIVGTIYVAAGCLIVSVPLGILTAVCITKFCGKKTKKILQQVVNILAGIPSIIYGFFGMIIIVPVAKEMAYMLGISGASGSGIFVGSIVLGIMVLPTIVNLSVTAIESVPKSYFEGATALGASKEKAIISVILPAAKSGIFTSVILGMGRAIGETMALALVLGNSATFPKSIFHSMENLTVAIVKELSYAEGLHYQALISIGLVLFVFILIISFSLNFIKKGKKNG